MQNKYNALKYFSYTFILTTVFWGIGAYLSFDIANTEYMIYLLIGLMSPFLVAVFLLFRDKTSVLKSEFKGKFFKLSDIDITILPIMIFIMPFSIVISIVLSLFFGQSMDQLSVSEDFSFSTGVVPVLLLLLLAATFEELGWRGYGFESLEGRFNFLNTSIIFSILWSAWHLPLLFVNQSYQYNIYHENILYAINFYLSIIPMGIIISWIWIKNNRNILLAIIFHFIINISQELFDITQTTKMIQTFVLIFFTLLIVYFDREQFFDKRKLYASE